MIYEADLRTKNVTTFMLIGYAAMGVREALCVCVCGSIKNDIETEFQSFCVFLFN